MHRILFILVFLIFISSGINAENAASQDSIGVETRNAVRYIRHQVEAGEGWYSIARKYGISYSELRMANKENGDQLIIGHILLIPAPAKLNDPRFQKNYMDKKPAEVVKESKTQEKDKVTSQLKNKTHKVAPSETLFSISKKFSVTVDEIKAWNNLKSNTISVGQELIVGKEESTKNSESVKTQTEEKKTEERSEKKSTIIQAPVKTGNEAEKKGNPLIQKNPPADKAKLDEKKEPAKYTFGNGRKEINEQGVASWIDDDDINPNKYYALHRSAPIGTIIKITNRMNDSSVFVKVVGVLPDTGDNEGLIIKISKASAERLNVLDKKFQADLVYGLPAN